MLARVTLACMPFEGHRLDVKIHSDTPMHAGASVLKSTFVSGTLYKLPCFRTLMEDLKPKSGMLLRKRGAIINTSSGGARSRSARFLP